jgi:hypothetical protein
LDNPISFGAIADGYMTAANSWDGYMYVFGKGKSATTVTALPKTIAEGSQVLIEGTVLDQSPAQPGTPCVSKASMSQQMEYLHLQQQIGGLWNNETITGVPVTLTAIDANGTVYDLGKTTTNGYYGTFSMAWAPPQQGKYEIIASFAGDDSYGSSAAATAVAVSLAPATPAPTATILPVNVATTSDLMNYIVVGVVAIIITIAIAVAIAVVILKKRA